MGDGASFGWDSLGRRRRTGTVEPGTAAGEQGGNRPHPHRTLRRLPPGRQV